MRFIALTAAIIFTISAAAQDYRKLVTEGTEQLENGNMELAIKSYNDAIALEPENGSNGFLYANLALAYQKSGNNVKAEEMYGKALEQASDQTAILQQRGNMYLEWGKTDKAMADFNAILSKEPYNEEALYSRAYLHSKDGENEKAYTDYYKILTANPANEKARFALALLYSKNGENEKALLLLDSLIEKDPNNAAYYIACSEIEKSQKRYELAMVYLENGIEKCKEKNGLHIETVKLLIETGQKGEAKKRLDALARSGYYTAQMNALYKRCK